MSRPLTYLDFNATTPARPEVIARVTEIMGEGGNPSSVHEKGRKARAHVEDARRQVAALVGARPRDVIFTGGGTEANILAIKGAIEEQGIECLILSATEHPSVRDLAKELPIDVRVVGVDSEGRVEPAALEALLDTDRKSLVSFMMANNETGVLAPTETLVALAHEKGALVHCDAIQAAGKIDIDVAALGIDLLTLSAHKLGGPQGVGALILRPRLDIKAQSFGGGQEMGRRSGTENVAGIAGFGVAAELARKDEDLRSRLQGWRDAMEADMKAAVPETLVLGAGAPRLPNTSLIALPGVAAETQVIQMDLAGFAVSSGSACSSGKVTRSHVISAMGYGDDIAGSAIRISTGWSTTQEDIKAFTEAWAQMARRLVQKDKSKEGLERAAG